MSGTKVIFTGGPTRFQGTHSVTETPSILVLTLGTDNHIYQRVIDPDSGEFMNIYEFHSTRQSPTFICEPDEMG